MQDKHLPGEVIEHVVMETSIKNELFAAYPQMEPLVSDMHTRLLRLHEKYKLHPKFLIKKKPSFDLFVENMTSGNIIFCFVILRGGAQIVLY